jgi:integrase/recombinase XerD
MMSAAGRSTNPRRDGVTAEERERPLTDDPRLLEAEQRAAESVPSQPPLFELTSRGKLADPIGGLPALEPNSSLDLARAWYRRELEQARRPPNTIESYSYDLAKFQERVGHKPIKQITPSDVADFLGLASNRATRKRRLTSLRRFFRFLIDEAKVLKSDPADGFYPHAIQLRSPVPLFADEQERLLGAAKEDEAWALPAIWLMLKLGLTRGELLALRVDHIDTTTDASPIVYVFYEDVTKRGKERKLATDPEFAEMFANYLSQAEPVDKLFPYGFQAVNGMVERVRRTADLTKQVTPQVLRHTFAVDRAKQGATAEELIKLLGLADDARNRDSVERYIKLAAPPL